MESIESYKPSDEAKRINQFILNVQPAVILHVFHKRHPDIDVDELNPTSNPREIRLQAMTEWFGNDENTSDSKLFSELAATPEFQAKIDPNNIESVFDAYDAATTIH